ncbi:MAG: flavodoxin family protein [Lentihominibacter sp.]
MKTAIIYYSEHHGNTKKLIDAIAAENEITLINVLECSSYDLSDYDMIGFASGIYYSKFHKTVLKFAEENLPDNKKVFFLFTYGSAKDSYTKGIKDVVSRKGAEIAGQFGCQGFDSYGPFKLIGGIAKGHPDQTDLDNARAFYRSIL